MAFCEERIITFSAPSTRAALAKAKQIARMARFAYRTVGGGRVQFEFVGIMQLMELGVETEPGEVWWDLYRRKLSSGQRPSLIPSERKLRVFTDGVSDASTPKTRQRMQGRARDRQRRGSRN